MRAKEKIEEKILSALEIRAMTISGLAEKLNIDRYTIEKAVARLRNRNNQKIRIASWAKGSGSHAAVFGLGSRPDKERQPQDKSYIHPDNRIPSHVIEAHKLFDRCHAAGVRGRG